MVPQLQMSKNNWLRLLLAIVLLLALVFIGYVIWRWSLTYATADTAFVINGKQYSKSEVKKLTKYFQNVGMSQKEAAKTIYEIIKRDTAMQQAKIKTNEKDIEALLQRNYEKKWWTDKGAQWVARDEVNRNLIESMGNLSNAEGYIYLFHFSRYFLKGYDYTPPFYNDAKYIRQDRDYAKQKAIAIMDQLRNEKISPISAITKVTADQRLSPTGIGGGNQSGKFRGEYYGRLVENTPTFNKDRTPVYSYDIPIPLSVQRYFKNMSLKKGVSSLQVGKVQPDAAKQTSKESDYREAYYYFFYIEQPSTGASYRSYEQKLKTLPSKYVGV